MSLFTTSLNSGSNGNCYYVGNDNEAVFVDAGLSCREIEKRMMRSGLAMSKLRAIFVSHEHSDHIRGVEVLARKHNLPVYITEKTLKNSGLKLDSSIVKSFNAYEPVNIGNLKVTGFPKLHDAADPHSFVIEQDDIKVGVFTDIGSNCEHVIKNFKECHAIFLEANYDSKMLETGRYPYHLKQRIRGGHGHLSNAEALEMFLNHKPDFMSHVFLSHLSRDNNDPDMVLDLFQKHAGETYVKVASRYNEMGVYRINKSSLNKNSIPLGSQMSLF